MKTRINKIVVRCFMALLFFVIEADALHQFSEYIYSLGRTTKYFYWTTAYDSVKKEYKHFKNPAYSASNYIGTDLEFFCGGSVIPSKVGQTAIGDTNPWGGGEFHFANRGAYQWNFSGIQASNVKVNSVRLEIWYLAASSVTVHLKKMTNEQFNMAAQARWTAIGSATEYDDYNLSASPPGFITSAHFVLDIPAGNVIYDDIKDAISAGSYFSLAMMVDNDVYWPEDLDQFGAGMFNVKNNPYECEGVKLTVNYSLPMNITIQNNFSGGYVTVDGQQKTSPHVPSPIWYEGETHTLLSSSQENGGYLYDTQNSWTNTTTGATLSQNPYVVTVTADAVYRANFDPPKVAMTIDQKNSVNTTIDSIEIVESGTVFTKYAAPKTKIFPDNSIQVFRGTQKIISNEKYNYWTINNSIQLDVTNHRSFQISGTASTFKSQLKPVVDGTLFGVTLEGINVSDSVRFMDPWLIDYTDSYGMRNQGMSAPFKKVTTGGNPLGTGTSYKGVLLNQTTPVIYSVQAPSPKTIGGTTSYFLNWSVGGGANVTQPSSTTSPVVFTAANATVTANYKGTHITGVTNTLSNTSQRKTIRTEDGYLFLTYESMNRIWLERSVDGGTTWSICNNGPIDNGPEAKHSSIDYLTGQTSYNFPNEIFVSYQQKTSNGNYTIQLARFNNAGQKQSDHTIYTSPSSYSNNATPVIAVTWYYRNEWRKQVVGIWKEPAVSGVTAGLRWYGAYFIGSSFNWNNTELHYETITYTDAQSKNPTIDVYKYDNAARLNTLNYHIAWEQPYSSYTAVKYYKVLCGTSGLSLTGHLTPSSGNGYVYNLCPSITTVSNTASRLCWLGRLDTPNDIDELSRTIFTDPSNGGVFWNFGGYVTGSNISKNYDDLYGTTGYSIGWTQLNGSSYSNFAVKNSTLSSPVNLNSTGKDMHLHNSWDFTEQRGITLSTASPYSFLTTSPVQPPSGGGKELDKKGSVPILSGRMGVVAINDAQFHFMVGDISVNGKPVGFKQMYDTTTIKSQEDFQSFLVSDAFTLSNGIEFLYGVQFGVTDTASAQQSLGAGDNVRFIVELIDAATGSVIGTFDDVTYSASSIIPYSKIGYEVNTDGVATRQVRLRFSVGSNLSPRYTLSDVQSEYLMLAKNGSERIKRNINGAPVVMEYALDQNYPNPFNPTTTISYALPKNGLVTLKIYDALGREVATVVNEFKQSGRYTAQFDASRLSSGIYIYKLTSDKFTATKKMSFVK